MSEKIQESPELHSPTIDPRYKDVEFLFTITEETEFPNYHQLTQQMRESDTKVTPAWIKKGWPGFIVTDYATIEDCYRNWEIFSPEVSHGLLTVPFMGKTLVSLEGREHINLRKLVAGPFKKDYVHEHIEPLLRAAADKIIDEFIEDGQAELMNQFCKKFPMAIIGTVLGIPTDNWQEISAWARDIFLGTSEKSRIEASKAFSEYVGEVVKDRRQNPQQDLISTLCSTKVDGDILTDEDIKQFMMLLFPAGVDTTWLAIGNHMGAVLSSPDAKQRLLADPKLHELAVNESLRWEGPIALLPRITRSDTVIDGVDIPAGSTVCMAHSAANRDPEIFENPDQWILDRPIQKILSFSFGSHQCLGQHLAKLEMRVATEALLERLPNLRMTDDRITYWGTAVRGPSHLNVAFDPTIRD